MRKCAYGHQDMEVAGNDHRSIEFACEDSYNMLLSPLCLRRAVGIRIGVPDGIGSI